MHLSVKSKIEVTPSVIENFSFHQRYTTQIFSNINTGLPSDRKGVCHLPYMEHFMRNDVLTYDILIIIS